MATDSGYSKRDYLRICDVCGHRFHFSDLKPIGEMKFACPDDYPGLTALQISRFNARARPLIIRPNKYAKDYSQTQIYQLSEAQIFNFIASVSPAGERDGANDPLSAAWAAIYMADVIAQAKRPQTWDRTARTCLARNLTYLLTLQYGSPTGSNPTGTVDNPRYGGILDGAVYKTRATIAAGLAFIKAYSAIGITDYLAAAERVATFVRHAQSGDKQTTAYTVFPVAGGLYHTGGLSRYVDNGTGLLDYRYDVADVAALWFLRLLANVKGESTAYGDAAATAFFSAPTSATITTMISELTSFAETGVHDSTSTDTFVPGLSTTAPRTTYLAALSAGGGNAAWETPTYLTTDDIALALAGLYQANGTSTTTTAMMTWLASFTSNANNRTPADASEEDVFQGITGTYDPTLCPADRLGVSAPFTEADGALYDWSSFGLLSPILTQSQAAYRNSKDTLSSSVRYTTLDVTNKYLGPIGSSGLSLQPIYRSATGALIGAVGGIGGSAGSATPPMTGHVFWVKGDAGVTPSGIRLSAWANQASGPNPGLLSEGTANSPVVGSDSLNGIPGVVWEYSDVFAYQYVYLASTLGAALTMKDRNGVNFGYGAGETQARTCWAIVRPRFIPGYDIVGGCVMRFGQTALGGNQDFEALFNIEPTAPSATNFMLQSNQFRTGPTHLCGPSGTTGGAAGTYTDVPLAVAHSSSGFDDIHAYVNGLEIALNPSVLQAAFGGAAVLASFVFGSANQGGDLRNQWHGTIFEGGVYDHKLSESEWTALNAYITARTGLTLFSNAQTSIMRAAKTGLAYRQDPGRYPALRGN